MAEDSVELEELREAARISSIYQTDIRKFRRNANLSKIVHAMLHFSEFVSVVAVEVFHHLHHLINRLLRENNPDIPDVPEERHLIFFGLPVCMTTSLILSILWFFFRSLKRKTELATFGCCLGIILMLLSGIFSMRHAELYINVDEIRDEDLLFHPIFIHNFVLCVLSIFALMIYLIHFWILYDCLRWEWKNRDLEDISRTSTESYDSGSSRPTSSERSDVSHELSPIPTWDGLQRRPEVTHQQVNIQDEPIVLYCCCLDFWNYLKHKKRQKQPLHEFQVVHVM